MSRFLHQAVSSITLVGYFLAVTWGPAWHDHHHGPCHAPAEMDPKASADRTASSPGGCCSHQHAACSFKKPEPAACSRPSVPAPSPCQSPLHDDDCIVCRNLAHPPLAAPAIQVAAAVEPMLEWVIAFRPAAICPPPAVYDSRAPPAV